MVIPLSFGQWATLLSITCGPLIILSFCWTYGTVHAHSILNTAKFRSYGTPVLKMWPLGVHKGLAAVAACLALQLSLVWVLMGFFYIMFVMFEHPYYFPGYVSWDYRDRSRYEPRGFHIWVLLGWLGYILCALGVMVVLLDNAIAPCLVGQGNSAWHSLKKGRKIASSQRKWRLKIWLIAQLLPFWVLYSVIAPLMKLVTDVLEVHGNLTRPIEDWTLIAGIVCLILVTAGPTLLMCPFLLVPNAFVFHAHAEADGGNVELQSTDGGEALLASHDSAVEAQT